MDQLQPNPVALPPALRALALGLLVETIVPMINKALQEGGPLPSEQGEGNTEDEYVLLQALRCKCRELSSLVLRADDPEEAADYLLSFLPKHIDYVFELVHGQKRSLSLCELKAGCRMSREDRSPVADPW